jgi:hypothetical protein
MNLMDTEEAQRVNVFDWQAEFPDIFKAGGFDAVIGNPPYGALLIKQEQEYLRTKFDATTNDLDTFALFIERSVNLIRKTGKVSMIVPTGWYSGAKFSKLRRFIAVETDPEIFINLPYDIFNAWVDTTIFVLAKRINKTTWPRNEKCNVILRTFPKRHQIYSIKDFETDLSIANICDWFLDGADEYLTYADASATLLIRKIKQTSIPLGKIADVQRGVTPYRLLDTSTHATCKSGFDGTVRRYETNKKRESFIRFDETIIEQKPLRYFQGPRILLRELISRQFRLQAVKTTEDFVTNKSMQSILVTEDGYDINYVLGIINSNLMSWYFLRLSNIAQRDDFPKIVLKESRSLPIRPIYFSNQTDKSHHDRMVQLVEQMLALHKQLANAKTGHEQTLIQRQIDATDRQIDKLVYELYGLTEDEIKIVEGR